METKELKEYVPGLAGVPAVRSAISYIDGFRGLLAYRGIPVEQLARGATYTETAWLLVHGHLPTRQELAQWDNEIASSRAVAPAIVDVIRALPRGGHPMLALQAGAAALGMTAGDHAPADARRASVVALIAQVPTLVAAFQRARQGNPPLAPRDDLGFSANFLWMLSGKEPDPLCARILDVCLILHAEHTINASTFGALVTASTLADPSSVVSAAVGALAGELHGGANERVLRMLREIGTVDRAAPYVEARVAAGQKIMGVGHRVYKTKDPRATILQELAVRLFETYGPTPLYDVALEVERVVSDRLGHRGIYPNVDFYSGMIYDKMGIPSDLFTPVFAIARVAGWLAHWVEQLQDNKLFRPTQIYVGEHGNDYVPVESRG